MLGRVVLAADPKEADIKQPYRRGEHALAVELVSPEVASHATTQLRQHAREVEHLVELLLVAARAPERVVQVLLAPGGVDPGGLQMTHRIRQIHTS